MNDPTRTLPSQSGGCGGDTCFAVSRVRGQSLPEVSPVQTESRQIGLVPALARWLAALHPVGTIVRKN